MFEILTYVLRRLGNTNPGVEAVTRYARVMIAKVCNLSAQPTWGRGHARRANGWSLLTCCSQHSPEKSLSRILSSIEDSR